MVGTGHKSQIVRNGIPVAHLVRVRVRVRLRVRLRLRVRVS